MPLTQPLIIADEGTDQGVAYRLNFVGAGVSVLVAAAIATVTISGGGGGGAGDLALSNKAPASNFTVTAGWSAYVAEDFELVSGVEIEIGLGATLEIG